MSIDIGKCSVLSCTDRVRYMYAVAAPGRTLPPVANFVQVGLCGTHAKRPWPWPAMPVRSFLGTFHPNG